MVKTSVRLFSNSYKLREKKKKCKTELKKQNER